MISTSEEKRLLVLKQIFDDVSSVTDEDVDTILKQLERDTISARVYWDPNSETKLSLKPKRNITYFLFDFFIKIQSTDSSKEYFKNKLNQFLECLKEAILKNDEYLTKLPGQIQMKSNNSIDVRNYYDGQFPLSIIPNTQINKFLFDLIHTFDTFSKTFLKSIITKDGELLNEFSDYQEIFDTKVISQFIQDAKECLLEGNDPSNIIDYINSFSEYFSEDFRNNIFQEVLTGCQNGIKTCNGKNFAQILPGILRAVERFKKDVEPEFKPFFTPDKFKGILIETLNRMNREGKNTIYFYLRLFNVIDKIGIPLSEIIVDEEYNIKVPLNETSTSYWLSNRDEEIYCLKLFLNLVKDKNIKTTLQFNQEKELSVFKTVNALLETVFCLLGYHQVDLSEIDIEMNKSLSKFISEVKDRPELFTGKVECTNSIDIELDVVEETFTILSKAKEV